MKDPPLLLPRTSPPARDGAAGLRGLTRVFLCFLQRRFAGFPGAASRCVRDSRVQRGLTRPSLSLPKSHLACPITSRPPTNLLLFSPAASSWILDFVACLCWGGSCRPILQMSPEGQAFTRSHTATGGRAETGPMDLQREQGHSLAS